MQRLRRGEKMKSEEKCEECGSKLKIEKTPKLTHYAKLVCPKHGFIEWKSKPGNQGKRKKSSKYSIKQVIEFHNQEERCFFCRRKRSDLANNQTLTVDHIHEVNNGGKDELENLQILCTSCHKMKNHMRLYHNWHFNGKPEGDQNSK